MHVEIRQLRQIEEVSFLPLIDCLQLRRLLLCLDLHLILLNLVLCAETLLHCDYFLVVVWLWTWYLQTDIHRHSKRCPSC